jgi:hypothetical protein
VLLYVVIQARERAGVPRKDVQRATALEPFAFVVSERQWLPKADNRKPNARAMPSDPPDPLTPIVNHLIQQAAGQSSFEKISVLKN